LRRDEDDTLGIKEKEVGGVARIGRELEEVIVEPLPELPTEDPGEAEEPVEEPIEAPPERKREKTPT
jgi:hypothetical protein